MGMLGACSQVVPMKRMMRRQMLFMQLWIRGWMNAGKKEGRKNYNTGLGYFLVFLFLSHSPPSVWVHFQKPTQFSFV